MNKFNLTFSGEILAGYDPADVKHSFGRMFDIEDPERLERFFTGQTVVLRRNLDRKAAAQYFHELHLLGAVAALVKVTDSQVAAAPASLANSRDARRLHQPAISAKPRKPVIKESGLDDASQVWAVSSRIARADHENTASREGGRENLDISARIKARRTKSRRQAEEVSAEKNAELQGREREDDGEKAQRAEEKKQRADAEAAERKVRRKAVKAKRARKKNEESARHKAELEAKQRREAEEEAARHTAELEAKQRREAEEESARHTAEVEAKQRREAEEAARHTAELEAKQRREAEEEAARHTAELEAKQRREAEEEAARRRAEEEEIKRFEVEEAARLQAEIAAIKRQEEAETKRVKAESRRRQLEAERKSAERLRTLKKTGPARFKQPVKSETGMPATDHPGQRKRQPGAPNLYQLRPFRNSKGVRDRHENARHLKRRSYTLGVLALVVSLVTAERFFQSTPDRQPAGVTAAVADAGAGLVLLAGNTLLRHDRAGVSTGNLELAELGLYSLDAPLAFHSENLLIAPGVLAPASGQADDNRQRQLLRCDLAAPACQPFSPEPVASAPATFVSNPVDGSVIVARERQLVKLNSDGEPVARIETALPDQPVLRLHAGLLFVNSADGPGISVYRYENEAFGTQLDEILLLPPAAVEAGQSRVSDFLWSGDAWWASLYNPETGSVGVYRFDDEWNSLGAVTLPVKTVPLQLTAWGEKTLVSDLRSVALQRFNAGGQAETPFISSALEELFDNQQRRTKIREVAWRFGLLVSTLATALGLGLGYLHGLREIVYKPRRERGAEPVDDYAHVLQWIEPIADRSALLRFRLISFGLTGAALLLLAVAQSVSAWQLAALLLALSGPTVALLLFTRSPIGHIGVLEDRLLLVDHGGQYHFASGSRIQYRGSFLLIDDVVVFTGNSLLPAFSPAQVREQVRPVAAGGVKVDRNTVLVKLLQCRHPLALGSCAIVTGLVAAAALLSLQGIF